MHSTHLCKVIKSQNKIIYTVVYMQNANKTCKHNIIVVISVSPCDNNPWENNGTCSVDVNGNATCTCDGNWSGTYCQSNLYKRHVFM
jgi:hypothetical protein